MVKTIFSGAWRIGRVTALALGLAVMLALVVGVASAALGANGGNFILGQNNVATAITQLAGLDGVNGPMMRIVNNNADANDTALSLAVQSGEAPLRVNSATKVANLNADKLDGIDSLGFYPSGSKVANSDKLDGLDSSAFVKTNTNAFVRNSIYQSETAQSTGALLGDGTRKIIVSCAPGDLLLSGGPANVDAGTILLESFPKDNTWSALIQNDSSLDSFSVVALCANQ